MNNPLLISLLIGAASGLIAALCGVGGGIVMVPAFVLLLGLDQKHAVATSLAAMVLTALVASWKNQANHLVNWSIALPTALAARLVAFFAADALKSLSNQTLTRIFAVVMIIVGARMLWLGR